MNEQHLLQWSEGGHATITLNRKYPRCLWDVVSISITRDCPQFQQNRSLMEIEALATLLLDCDTWVRSYFTCIWKVKRV